MTKNTKKARSERKGLQGDFVKIKPDESESLLGAGSKSEYRGVVVAVSRQATCEKGDKVIFNGWARDEIELDGEIYYYIHTEYILEIL